MRRAISSVVRMTALAASVAWLAACGASLNNDQKAAVGGSAISSPTTPASGPETASGGKGEAVIPAPTVKAVNTLTAVATPGSTGYLIGSQDVLEINVFKVPELTKTVQVAETGTINLPLLNEVPATGKTSQQLERELTTKLAAKYLQDPQVSVSIREYNSQRVTVDGAVKKPGVYPVRGNLTLLQAISMAEGLDPAAESTVVVFRTVDGKRNAAKFDVSEIRDGKIEDPALRPGDLIVAPSSMMKETFNNVIKVLPLAGVFAMVL